MPFANIHQITKLLLDDNASQIMVRQWLICRTRCSEISQGSDAICFESALLIDGKVHVCPDIEGIATLSQYICPESRKTRGPDTGILIQEKPDLFCTG